ncbi:MAG TPA: SDR family NAD(P)-dependent oxidoreductase [Acidimicrobiales bacterium]|nr:SDR family NAD(P)-dependent oxidoreductase [Acidimicrobiales bacterium]
MLEFGLEGKRALVAGSGPGLGRSCALGLAEAGAAVMCTDLDASRAEAVAREIRSAGGTAEALATDLTRSSAADEAVGETLRVLGGLDVVVDVIGEIRWGRATDLTDEDWDYSFDFVLRQAFNLTRSASHHLVQQGSGGSIVCLSSVSGLESAPFHAPYGAAKAGLMSLTRSLAIELASEGIRVNCVAPGAIATPRVIARVTGGQSPVNAPLPSRAPLGRMGDPDEIGKVVVFLLSDLASYITGQTITVDGGATAQYCLGAMRADLIPDNATLDQPRR